jgi:hypothetical protein
MSPHFNGALQADGISLVPEGVTLARSGVEPELRVESPPGFEKPGGGVDASASIAGVLVSMNIYSQGCRFVKSERRRNLSSFVEMLPLVCVMRWTQTEGGTWDRK